MRDKPRNPFGNTIQPDSPRVSVGQNANPAEYIDKVGKQVPTPSCVLEDGTPIYGKDGLTQDWWATHTKGE